MRLLHIVTLRLSLLAAIVMAFWSVLFYFALINEIDDEVDDSLETYSEVVMLRALSGEVLPTPGVGSNNQYVLREVAPGYAAAHRHIRYEDREVYIKERKEHEPARVLTHIFRTDNGRWMELEVSTPTIEKDDLREAIFVWMVCLYAVLLFGIALVNYVGIRRNMRPVYRLLRWLDRYVPGTQQEPLHNPTDIREFRRLNEVVASAITRSEALHEQQKQFVGNASHEMQTPLAVSIGRLEMLMDDEGLTEQQMGEVVKTHRTLENLSRMNRSLLLLCKIEGGQFTARTTVGMNALLRNCLPDYAEAYGHKGISVALDEPGSLSLEMDESLAATLLSSLLKNAYVHNVAGGEIRITVSATCLRVANTGCDAPLDADRIFTRFYHTQGKTSSTGLGLSIAQAICRLYGLGLRYAFEGGLHVFEISKLNKS